MTSHRPRRPLDRFGDGYAFDAVPTLDGPPSTGYHLTTRSRTIGHGRAAFEAAGAAVLTWQVHRGSGFVPLDVPPTVAVGVSSVWAVTFGPLRPPVACRVFAVVRDDREIGFGHAALVGHPQRGWESYLVRHHDDDRVTLDIRVVWRPAAWWMRAAGPMSGLALALILRRNLRALDDVVSSTSRAGDGPDPAVPSRPGRPELTRPPRADPPPGLRPSNRPERATGDGDLPSNRRRSTESEHMRHDLTVSPEPWDAPDGATLRAAQRVELDARYGSDDHEPGTPPTAADVAVFVVARDAVGRALGCGGLRPLDDGRTEIKRMYVTPDARGTGVSTAVLGALEQEARRGGVRELVLETGTLQPDAMRFYEREGYRRIDLFGAYIGSDNSVCYAKTL